MHRPTIGYIAPATGGFFFGALLAGVVRATAEVGGLVVAVQTVEAQTEGVDEVALRALEGFSIEVGWSRCDAFLCAAEAVGGAYLRRLLASGRPVVSICKEHEGISCPSVMPDNRDGVRRAVAHLVAHGHRRIGFVGNLVQSDMRQRFTGYRQALVEHGIPVDPALHFESSDNMSLGGESAARAILAAGVPTTALVVATDRNAIALMRTLREAGLSLPGDQAVIGFDDVDEGAQLDPALTTVNPGFDRLGELAARCALRMVAGERVEPGQHTAGASLVIRQSCGCRNPIIRTSEERGEGRNDREGHGIDPRGALRVRLEGVLGCSAEGQGAWGEKLSDAEEAVLALLYGTGDGTSSEPSGHLETAVSSLSALSTRFEATAEVVRALYGQVREAQETGLLPAGRWRQTNDALLELSLALLQQDVRRSLAHQTYLERTMSAHYDVSRTMISDSGDDPTRISWLVHTDADLGCLALWPHGAFPAGRFPAQVAAGPAVAPPLEIVGVYGAGDDSELLGATIDVREFPPRGLLDRMDPKAGKVLHVMSIVHGGCQRGLLATLGPVEGRAQRGRDRSNQWAALLTVALERRRTRELAEAAKERERILLAELRVSEERYTLAARAANDGLWDWDTETDTVYYSARWKALLGFEESDVGSSPKEWFSRVHPDDAAALDREIAACREGSAEVLAHEFRMRTCDGSYRWMLCRGLVVAAEDSGPRLVGSLTDIDDRRRMEEQLRFTALYDTLTGLANRALFTQRLEQALATYWDCPSRRFAVLFCDLDGFKQVNDAFGHRMGDLLLTQMAGRIRDNLRAEDLPARLGGDEFAILLSGVSVDEVDLLVDRLTAAICTPVRAGGVELSVGVSIGVATSDGHHANADDVLGEADAAMYHHKHQHRNRSGSGRRKNDVSG